MHLDYDIPNLIKEKKNIIAQLETEKQNRFIIIISLGIISSFLFVLLVWYYQKQKKYKKRFEKLLSDNFKIDKVSNISNPQELDIPEAIIESVLKKLASFEEKQGFLKLNLTVSSLAKEFDTNSKYFSKIVNTYKGKSFTNYINDLRIEHAVNELKNKPKFRKYTVKAIANDIGFNTTEAFSKSFYKVTGIHPSFFIKQLEKQ